MPISTLRSNPQDLSGKPLEEKWTLPELVSPTKTTPQSHNPPHQNCVPRHYTRPSWKRNPRPIYKKILANPEAVRDDLELPQYAELRHIPENIDQEHKQALYYDQILDSRDRSFTTQHESIKKDIHEGQVRRTTIPAKKHELPPDRREKFEIIIQDQRYDEDCVERDEWKGHGWLERARAELEFPREFDRLWEEWMLRGRRTSQQERELNEREREIEREEQEARILEYVRRNMEDRERIRRKVLVEDRVERKLIPRLRWGTRSWEEVEKERFWYGEGDDVMKNGQWPEALRYIDFVPLRSFPGEVLELPGDFENPVEMRWSYWYRDAHQLRLEQEEERRQQAESEPENDEAGDSKWYRIIVSQDFANDCSIQVDWHKSPHVASDEHEAFVSEYWLGWIFGEAAECNRLSSIRGVRQCGDTLPEEGRTLNDDGLEALVNRLQDDFEERACIEYRIKADLHFGEHGDEDWVTSKAEGVKFLLANEMVLRRAVLEEEERRGGAERPGILGVQVSSDGGETVEQWGLEEMQVCRATVQAEARLHRIFFEDAAASGRDIHGKGKGRASDAGDPRERWGRGGVSTSKGERPTLAVVVPEQPAFADVDAAKLLRQQFNQTHGKKKANQATVEDDEEEEL